MRFRILVPSGSNAVNCRIISTQRPGTSAAICRIAAAAELLRLAGCKKTSVVVDQLRDSPVFKVWCAAATGIKVG